MLVALPVLICVLAGSAAVFLRLSPTGASRRTVGRFNGAALGACGLACGAIFLWVRGFMAGTADAAWWPVVGAIYCGAFVPVFLLAAGLIRWFGCRRR
jgi:hypothetical protein